MNVIVDTGPIVAFLNENDRYHQFVKEKMKVLDPPFYTCEAVLTESFFLLQRISQGSEKLIELIETDRISVTFSYKQHSKQIHRLVQQYMNVPMSFADACLVRMAETTKQARIFTLDSDFSIYRTTKGKSISLISPS